MIAMKFTIELDMGLSFLLQPALSQLVTDRETKLKWALQAIVRPLPAPH